ncbi:MAG: hypothetical protein DI535_30255 [Citrobacter freundii]|nr:MAG: hypothetical protein DI535_30255 [Citrobacter freundii]
MSETSGLQLHISEELEDQFEYADTDLVEVFKSNRITTMQSISGTGALRIGSEFLVYYLQCFSNLICLGQVFPQ